MPASPLSALMQTYFFTQVDLRLRAIARRQHVPYRKQEQKQFDRAAHGIVLVTRLDVPQDDGGSGHALELRRGIVQDARHDRLRFLKIHGLEQRKGIDVKNKECRVKLFVGDFWYVEKLEVVCNAAFSGESGPTVESMPHGPQTHKSNPPPALT